MVLRNFSKEVEREFLSVKIPQRKERKPTDILRALEQTVQRDPTAFHYKYPDDPFFFPYSNLDKRSLALSLESGRKSAKWIVNNNPSFFNEKISEPFIKAFTPKIVYNDESDVTEDILISVIKEKNVTEAIKVYHLLDAKNIDVSNDTKQLLLELVCFYNCDEKGNEEDLELKWFKIADRPQVLKTWKDEGFAETLFKTMIPDDPLAYSTIIQGRLRFNQVEKGFELYNIARDKNFTLSVNVYNELLACVNNIKGSGKERWRIIEGLLNDMDSKGVQPNLYTLNAILESLHFTKSWSSSLECALKTIKEFKKLGISLSLGSYYYLIKIYMNTSFIDDQLSLQVEEFLTDTINVLIKSKLEIQHPSDMLFFEKLMICAKDLNSCNVAILLNTLLEANGNIKFIRNEYALTIFYHNYMSLMFQEKPIHEALDVYRTLVPSVTSLENQLLQAILSAIERQNAFKYLSEIWEDIVLQKKDFTDVLVAFIKMVEVYEGKEKDEVYSFFSDLSNVLLKRLEEDNSNRKYHVDLTSEMVSCMLIAFVKSGNYDKALSVFNNIKSDIYPKNISYTAAEVFFYFCISSGHFSELMDCLKHTSVINHPKMYEMATAALIHSNELNDSDVKWLTNLVKNQEKVKTE